MSSMHRQFLAIDHPGWQYWQPYPSPNTMGGPVGKRHKVALVMVSFEGLKWGFHYWIANVTLTTNQGLPVRTLHVSSSSTNIQIKWPSKIGITPKSLSSFHFRMASKFRVHSPSEKLFDEGEPPFLPCHIYPFLGEDKGVLKHFLKLTKLLRWDLPFVLLGAEPIMDPGTPLPT